MAPANSGLRPSGGVRPVFSMIWANNGVKKAKAKMMRPRGITNPSIFPKSIFIPADYTNLTTLSFF